MSDEKLGDVIRRRAERAKELFLSKIQNGTMTPEEFVSPDKLAPPADLFDKLETEMKRRMKADAEE